MSTMESPRSHAPLGHDLFGAGPGRVVILNDWMCDTSTWDGARVYLDGARFTWAFADLRGYGRSRGRSGAFTVTEAAADVVGLADALAWQRFAIIGYLLFDLIRNGIAHQYHQIPVRLTDAQLLCISLTGATHPLDRSTTLRDTDHLMVDVDEDRNLWLKVCPDLLFIDFRDAIHAVRAKHPSPEPNWFAAPNKNDRAYSYSSAELFGSLKSASHGLSGVKSTPLGLSPTIPTGVPYEIARMLKGKPG